MAEEPPALVEVPDWRTFGRVQAYDPAGFPCFDRQEEPRTELIRLFYKHPVVLAGAGTGFAGGAGVSDAARGDASLPGVALAPVRVGEISCLVAASAVGPVHTMPVECLTRSPGTVVAPLSSLVEGPLPEAASGTPVGPLFPTFYQVAFEVLYPRKADEATVALKDRKGRIIEDVSPQFRKALLIQGTGALADGRVVNVAGSGRHGRRFVVLPRGSYGLGIAGYNLYPYRSAAVDFDWLCDKLSGAVGCKPGNLEKRDRGVTSANRKALVGMLLYLPRLDGARMADGTVHDGRVCAVDVGGGIRNDRIDLFVGTDGAGNPYYPSCRRDNPWISSGVQSLIPSDWRRFVPGEDGVLVRELETEYRQVSPGKGLEVMAFPSVRCRREALSNPD
jgi:hypothetical protein